MLSRNRVDEEESERSQNVYSNAIIKVGPDHQAVIPPLKCQGFQDSQTEVLYWRPLPSSEDQKIESYVNHASEIYGYSEEQALALLTWKKFDFESAVEDLENFAPIRLEWTPNERRIFFSAMEFHCKNFHKVKELFPDRPVTELVLFYYLNKRNQQALYELTLHAPQFAELHSSGLINSSVQVQEIEDILTLSSLTQPKEKTALFDPDDPLECAIASYLDALSGVAESGAPVSSESNESNGKSSNNSAAVSTSTSRLRSRATRPGADNLANADQVYDEQSPPSPTSSDNDVVRIDYLGKLVNKNGLSTGASVRSCTPKVQARIEAELMAMSRAVRREAKSSVDIEDAKRLKRGFNPRTGIIESRWRASAATARRKVKLLPHAALLSSKSSADDNASSKKKHISVNVLTASDTIPAFSTPADSHPQIEVESIESPYDLATPVSTASPLEAELDSFEDIPGESYLKDLEEEVTANMETMRPPTIPLNPDWSQAELALVVEIISEVGEDYEAIAERMVNKTPSMVAWLFKTKGHQLRLHEVAAMAEDSRQQTAAPTNEEIIVDLDEDEEEVILTAQ